MKITVHKKVLRTSLISLISTVLLVLTIKSCYVLLRSFYYFFGIFSFLYTTFIFLASLTCDNNE
jgi:uncharacterized membrane protein